MKKRIPSHIQQRLKQREDLSCLRELSKESYKIDFYSNDYLGFASSSLLKEETDKIINSYPIQNGATGSRLISGNFSLIEETEKVISTFHASESALLFTSGYTANIGLFSCLAEKGDIFLYDELIHASIRDGMRLSKASCYKFKHNDTEHLSKLLERFCCKVRNVYVITESIFSMDGDSPDLVQISNLCEEYNAYLIVDEAHSFGVYGENGQGHILQLGLENKVLASIVTYGKAMGCHGATILSSSDIKSYLVNFARSFIYTTGMSAHNVAQIKACYKIREHHKKELEKLHHNISLFLKLSKHKNIAQYFIPSKSPIQSVLVGGNKVTKEIASELQAQSIGVKAILSPSVPKGKERLRICLHSFNTEKEILLLVQTLEKYLSKL